MRVAKNHGKIWGAMGIFAGGLLAATHWSAPQLVLSAAVLVLVSFFGLPVPITATILLAGALATRMTDGGLVFLALWLSLTLCMSLRDVLTFLLSKYGWRWLRRMTSKAPSVKTAHASQGMVVRRRIHLPVRHVASAAMLRRRRERARMAQATRRLMAHWGIPTVVISRLTPLTTPCDIAAAVVGMSLNVFTAAVVLGRVLYVLAWLGAGALSGQAWQHGATVPQLVGIVAVIVLALIVVPSLLSRRWLLQTG